MGQVLSTCMEDVCGGERDQDNLQHDIAAPIKNPPFGNVNNSTDHRHAAKANGVQSVEEKIDEQSFR